MGAGEHVDEDAQTEDAAKGEGVKQEEAEAHEGGKSEAARGMDDIPTFTNSFCAKLLRETQSYEIEYKGNESEYTPTQQDPLIYDDREK